MLSFGGWTGQSQICCLKLLFCFLLLFIPVSCVSLEVMGFSCTHSVYSSVMRTLLPWLQMLGSSSLFFFLYTDSSLGVSLCSPPFSFLWLLSYTILMLFLSFGIVSLFCVPSIFSGLTVLCPFGQVLDTWYWAVISGSSSRHLVNSEWVNIQRAAWTESLRTPTCQPCHFWITSISLYQAYHYLSAPLEAPAFERKETDFLAKCDPKDHSPPTAPPPTPFIKINKKNNRASWAIRDTSCFPLLKASWIDETEGSKGLSASGAWGLAGWLLTLCCLLLWVA